MVYLLLSKRLFGIRGGGRAFEAQKHAEALMTVELAACKRDLPEARSALSETVVLNRPPLTDPTPRASTASGARLVRDPERVLLQILRRSSASRPPAVRRVTSSAG